MARMQIILISYIISTAYIHVYIIIFYLKSLFFDFNCTCEYTPGACVVRSSIKVLFYTTMHWFFFSRTVHYL